MSAAPAAKQQQAQPLPWYKNFLCAGIGACTAEVATLPIDTAKVRLQLLQKAATSSLGSAAAAPAKIGMVGMMKRIATTEGTAALYKGLMPALQRQIVFASLRIGLYGQISAYFRKPGEDTISLPRKILAGFISGAIGITVANPTDLVKVRMQAEGNLPAGVKPRYSGVMNAYSTIVKQEGVRGLWTGLGPAVFRNSIINATELATYDTAKEYLLRDLGMKEGFAVHFLGATATGIMATIVGNPVDVVKTRVMAAKRAVDTAATTTATGSATVTPAGPTYTGAIDCIVKTMKNEGPAAFYQGVVPQFYRLTGWSIVMFVTFENLKKLAASA